MFLIFLNDHLDRSRAAGILQSWTRNDTPCGSRLYLQVLFLFAQAWKSTCIQSTLEIWEQAPVTRQGNFVRFLSSWCCKDLQKHQTHLILLLIHLRARSATTKGWSQRRPWLTWSSGHVAASFGPQCLSFESFAEVHWTADEWEQEGLEPQSSSIWIRFY